MYSADIPLMSINEIDNEAPEESQLKPKFKAWGLQTWRFTITSGALAASLILLVNIITLAVMYGKFSEDNYTITFFTGSCQTASTVTIVSHVIINVLSTILLAASNFSMQCLSSPTRKEVDSAHSRQRWLSIGTPNIRNLFFVSKAKSILWVVLGISSFPLHMFWNSTVFQTRATNNYLAVTVTEDFLHGASWTIPSGSPDGEYNELAIPGADKVPHYRAIVNDLQQKATKDNLESLSVTDCLKAYGQDQISDRKHVLLVVDNNATTFFDNSSVLAIYYNLYTVAKDTAPLFLWICPSSVTESDVENEGAWTCPSNLLKSGVNDWVPGGAGANGAILGSQEDAPVRACYSQSAPEQCKANIVPIFLIVVVICNVIKLICFIFALRITRKDQPLCTTGDAIQSFIKEPDPHTQGRCLVSKHDYETIFHRSREWAQRPSNVADLLVGGRWRWGKSVRMWQWVFYVVVVCIVILIAGFHYDPLGLGTGSSKIAPAILGLGIGQPHQSYAITDSGVSNILTGFLSANTPQIIVSYIYLALNNIMTTMLAMNEWCSYFAGTKRLPKGLRVSSPVKKTEQKSTYTLSVPLKWGIPTCICIAVLHWAASETIFLARIDVYDVNSRNVDQESSVTNIFYSLMAKYILVAVGAALVITLVLISIFAKYPEPGILAGCCSASISAACQPIRVSVDGSQKRFPEDLPYKRLQWGVMEDTDAELGTDIGHATFGTSVSPLIPGKLYA